MRAQSSFEGNVKCGCRFKDSSEGEHTVYLWASFVIAGCKKPSPISKRYTSVVTPRSVSLCNDQFNGGGGRECARVQCTTASR